MAGLNLSSKVAARTGARQQKRVYFEGMADSQFGQSLGWHAAQIETLRQCKLDRANLVGEEQMDQMTLSSAGFKTEDPYPTVALVTAIEVQPREQVGIATILGRALVNNRGSLDVVNCLIKPNAHANPPGDGMGRRMQAWHEEAQLLQALENIPQYSAIGVSGKAKFIFFATLNGKNATESQTLVIQPDLIVGRDGEVIWESTPYHDIAFAPKDEGQENRRTGTPVRRGYWGTTYTSQDRANALEAIWRKYFLEFTNGPDAAEVMPELMAAPAAANTGNDEVPW